MVFFDTHCHLDYVAKETNEPLETLIQKAIQAGIEKILIVAVQQQDFKTIKKMTALYPAHLVYGLGLHPLYIEHHQQTDLLQLEQHLENRSEQLTALGEIGLERAVEQLINEENWRKQCDFLQAQLDLAKQYQLPVNLHSRRAHDQLYPFLKRANLSKCGVIHGFSGSYEQAKRFVDLGYKIGVGGTITYQRANKTRETIKKLPLDTLLLETDSPDMPIYGFQGQVNRPERIVNIFQALCELRQEPTEKIAQQIWQNSLKLFG